MLSVGLVYIALGLILSLYHRTRNIETRTSRRISMHFHMTGWLNTILYGLQVFIPEFEQMATLLSSLSVVLFALIMMAELNKDYRRFRETTDIQLVPDSEDNKDR